MKRNKPTYLVILLSVATLIFASCREEIVSPDNFSGNVNDPLQFREFNSYTFVVNAEHLTITVDDETFFSTNSIAVLYTIIDYASGNATIKVLTDGSVIFSQFLNKDYNSERGTISGFIPTGISISLRDFTGKLKVELLPVN